jgi:serine/threonine protein kinase
MGHAFRTEKLLEIEVASGQAYATEIASCIKKIPQKGVIHNNISPNNIMKSTSGHVTLLDFVRAGYLGDRIPPDKRGSNAHNTYYSA